MASTVWELFVYSPNKKLIQGLVKQITLVPVFVVIFFLLYLHLKLDRKSIQTFNCSKVHVIVFNYCIIKQSRIHHKKKKSNQNKSSQYKQCSFIQILPKEINVALERTWENKG